MPSNPLPEYLKFLAPYGPHIIELALRTRHLVLNEAPEATELIYDAYNAVATGYSFTGRPSDAFIHIAVYTSWINLGFNQGSQLNDPEGMLKGTGKWVRHIRILNPADLENTKLRNLVKAAITRAVRPDGATQITTNSVVRAIYAKRRRPVKPCSSVRSPQAAPTVTEVDEETITTGETADSPLV